MSLTEHNHATEPLVSCTACGFAWYGKTAAHGLTVVGRCTRCSGELRFHGGSPLPETGEHRVVADVAPSRVLGKPNSWA
jgi:hypothetical protein